MYNLRYFKNKQDYTNSKDSFIETTISCVEGQSENEVFFKLDPLSIISFNVDLEYDKTLATANGDILTPYVKYSQTIMDDKGVTSTVSGDTSNPYSGANVTFSSSIEGINLENGKVIVPTRGIEVGDKKTLGTVNVVVTINGVSKQNSITLYQQENIVEKSVTSGGETVYHDIVVPSIEVGTIAASGGTVSVSMPTASQSYSINDTVITYTYTSQETSQESIPHEGGVIDVLPSKFIVKASAVSKGIISSEISEISKEVVTYNGQGGKVSSYEVVINQDANKIMNTEYLGGETTYGDVEMGIVEEGIILASGGDGITYIGDGRQPYSTAEYIQKNQYSSQEFEYITVSEATNGFEVIKPSMSTLEASNVPSKGITISDKNIVTSATVTWVGFDDKSVSIDVNLYQEENQIVDEDTEQGDIVYGDVVKGEITNGMIDASGGTATAKAENGYQEWTTDASSVIYTYTSGEQQEVELTDNRGGINIIQPTYSILSATMDSKGRVESDITEVDSVKVEWFGNDNHKAEDMMYVYQAANELISKTYSQPTGLTISVNDIDASGGTISEGVVQGTISQKEVFTYTSGVYTDIINPTYTIEYSEAISTPSLGEVVKDRTQIGVLNYSYTANGMTSNGSVNIFQEANELISKNEILQCGNLIKGEVKNAVIPAKGGKTTATATNGRQSYTAETTTTYTSGVYTSSSNGERAIIAYPSSLEGEASSRGTVVGGIKTISEALVRWISLDNSEEITEPILVTQEANEETVTDIVMTYGDIVMGEVSVTPQVVSATGGTAIVTAKDGKQAFEEVTSYIYTSLETKTAVTSSGTLNIKATVNPSQLTFDEISTSTTEAPIKTSTITWEANGKQATTSTTATQELKRIVDSGVTYTYGTVTKGKIVESVIAASGDTGVTTVGNATQPYTAVTWTKYHTGDIVENDAVSDVYVMEPSFTTLRGHASSKRVEKSDKTVVTSDTVTWTALDGTVISEKVYVYQEANKEEYITSGIVNGYGAVEIGSVKNVKDIEASGDTIVITATNGSQSYTAYTNNYIHFTSLESLTTTVSQETFRQDIVPSPQSWSVHADSLGTREVPDKTVVSSQTFTWLGSGTDIDQNPLMDTLDVTIYQKPNIIERYIGGDVTYSNVTVGTVTVSGIIPAKGGNVTVSATNGTQVRTQSETIIEYSSKATAQTEGEVSETLDIVPTPSSVVVSAESLGITIKNSESVVSSITIDYISKYDNQSNSKTVTVKQAKNIQTVNKVEKYYDDFECGTIRVSSTNIPVEGGIATVIVTEGSEKWSSITTYDYSSEAQSTAVTDSGTNIITPIVDPSNKQLDFPSNVGNGNNITKTATATWNGYSNSCTHTASATQSSCSVIKQEVRYSWGNVTAGTITNATIPASGGDASATMTNGKQAYTAYTYDIYDYCDDVLVSENSGISSITPSKVSYNVHVDSRGTVVGDELVSSTTITWNGGGGKIASGTAYVTQEANELINTFYNTGITYGIPSVEIGSGMVASGGSATVTHSVTNTVTYYYLYTSNATSSAKTSGRTGTSTIKITSNGNSRFSLNGNTLSHSNMTTNATTDTVTITATNADSTGKTATASKSITNSYSDATAYTFSDWVSYDIDCGTITLSKSSVGAGENVTVTATIGNGTVYFERTRKVKTTRTYTSKSEEVWEDSPLRQTKELEVACSVSPSTGFTFSDRGTTTGNSISKTFTGTCSGSGQSCTTTATVTQAANTKTYSTSGVSYGSKTYATPSCGTITLSKSSVGAGESVTVTATIGDGTQTWSRTATPWSAYTYTSGDESTTNGTAYTDTGSTSVSCSVSPSTGFSFSNRGTTTGAAITKTFTGTCTANGKTCTTTKSVSQAANAITNSFANTSITYNTPSVSIGSGMVASGGSATVTHSVTNTVTYYDYYTSGSYGSAKTSGRTGTSTIKITSNGNSRFSLSGNKLSHSNMTTNATTDTVTITATNSDSTGKTATASKSITNTKTYSTSGVSYGSKTYATPSCGTITLSKSSVGAGESVTVTATIGNGTQTWSRTATPWSAYTYTSGDDSTTNGTSYTDTGSTSVSCSVSPSTGFSFSDRGTTTGSVITKTFTGTCTANGKTCTTTKSVSQEANEVVNTWEEGGVTTYGNIIPGTVTDAIIPASGGTSYGVTFTNGTRKYNISAKYSYSAFTSGDNDYNKIANASSGTEEIKGRKIVNSYNAASRGTETGGTKVIATELVEFGSYSTDPTKYASVTGQVKQEANYVDSVRLEIIGDSMVATNECRTYTANTEAVYTSKATGTLSGGSYRWSSDGGLVGSSSSSTCQFCYTESHSGTNTYIRCYFTYGGKTYDTGRTVDLSGDW